MRVVRWASRGRALDGPAVGRALDGPALGGRALSGTAGGRALGWIGTAEMFPFRRADGQCFHSPDAAPGTLRAGTSRRPVYENAWSWPQ
ncbi:hypothetical protein GCM10023160_00530 [Brachybacterium paraconglomeratum]